MDQPRLSCRRKPLRPHRQIVAKGHRSFVSQWNHALFAPLAANQNGLVGPLHTVEIQPYQLRVANAAAIQQLEDGAFPLRPADALFHSLRDVIQIFWLRSSLRILQ